MVEIFKPSNYFIVLQHIMTKRWKLDDIALACKAYISATNNPINGTYQDFHTFSLDLVDRFKHISPSDYVDGTYSKRGDRVYPYLRDNVFPDVQKFHKALYLNIHFGTH